MTGCHVYGAIHCHRNMLWKWSIQAWDSLGTIQGLTSIYDMVRLVVSECGKQVASLKERNCPSRGIPIKRHEGDGY